MKTWETFTMSRKEVPRAGLLKAARSGKISNAQGAGALHLSVRQFQRLKVRFVAEGPRGLLHRLRGRPAPRRLPADVRAAVAALLQSTYAGFNDCHATEKLREIEGLVLSRSSVRRLRRALGLPAKRQRRGRQVRTRRCPEAQMGSLVQLDASPFAWLEARGPQLALHGAIDDATGTVLALYFRPTEDLHGYVTLLRQLVTTYGLPLALYGDRLNVFVRNDPHWTLAEELRGTQDPTHFGRILRELGIGFIAAGSPQAKGRIERLWQTLQDRLVSELRLRGIATLEAANAFLPEFLADYNRRFTRAPADATAAWRCASAWTGASSFSLTATASPRSPRPPPNSSSAPAAAPVPTAASTSAPLSAPRARGAAIPLPPESGPFHRAPQCRRPCASRVLHTRGVIPPLTPPRTGG